VEPVQLSEEVRIKASGLRPLIRTTTEALRLISHELPAELRALPRWSFARDLLLVAEQSRKKRDLICATRQLRQALSNEGWLDSKPSAKAS
jgi:hypothetical protein